MTGSIPPYLGRSWWLVEALQDDHGEPCPPLLRDVTADVLVLGGGYTGMWTAHFLKERDPGVDVVLLEQDICGGGPSGRNGGFLDGWWYDADTLEELFGRRAALRLCEAATREVDEIGRWCDEQGVDAWYRRGGTMGVSVSPVQDGEWRSTMASTREVAGRDVFRELSEEEVRKRCDSPVFRGGVLLEDAATVQPARLARGLRRVLLEQGVRIFESTPVTRFRAGPPAVAEAPGGAVRAERAIVAVNAWGHNWKAFRRTLLVRGTYIVVTAPAPERLEDTGWTGGEGIYDFRTALHYVRTTPDGRIAFGGAGMQPDLGRTIGPRYAYNERSVRELAEDFVRWFPTFADVPLEAAWGGPIDVSGTHLPFFGAMGRSANVHYGLGFTGNGVGPCRLGGRILSGLALGANDAFTTLPIVGAEPKRFPPAVLTEPGAFVVNRAILRKDARQDRGERVGRLTGFVARLPRRVGYNLGPD